MFFLVLFPVVATVASAVISLLLSLFTATPPVWWHVAAYIEWTGAYYYLTYEYLHLMYHMDEKRVVWLQFVPFLAFLRRHHLLHHHQPSMRKINFNITVRGPQPQRASTSVARLIAARCCVVLGLFWVRSALLCVCVQYPIFDFLLGTLVTELPPSSSALRVDASAGSE
jgi:hypothetical protein